MTPLLLDIGMGELLVIAVLAAVLLGPERVPGLAKKAGRILRFLRGVANNATDQVKAELGVEDLVGQVLPGGLQSEMDALRSEMAGMRTEVARLQLASGGRIRRPVVSPPDVVEPDL